MIDPAGDGLAIVAEPGPRAAGLVAGPGQPGRPGPGPCRPTAGVRADQADPGRGRPRWRFDRRRRRAPLGRLHRPRPWPPVSAPTCRSAWWVAGRGAGIGEQVDHPSRTSPARSSCCVPPLRRSTRLRLPGLGRPAVGRARSGPWHARRRTIWTAAALAVEPRLAAWRDRFAELTGRTARARRQWLDLVRRGDPGGTRPREDRRSRRRWRGRGEPLVAVERSGSGYGPSLTTPDDDRR